MATFLIIVLVGIQKQMKFIDNKDLGYNDQNLIQVHTNWKNGEKLLKRFKEELKINILGITGRTGGINKSRLKFDGQEMTVTLAKVDQAYLKTLEIDLLEGRNLAPVQFPSDSNRAVIANQSLVKELGLTNPIGAQITSNWDKNLNMKIVSVFQDYHYQDLKSTIEPQILHLWPTHGYNSL